MTLSKTLHQGPAIAPALRKSPRKPNRVTCPTADSIRPGQEGVWDFLLSFIAQSIDPRLPIARDGRIIAETRHGVRAIETSHPPTYNFPRDEIALEALQPVGGSRICELKGSAVYFDVQSGEHA